MFYILHIISNTEIYWIILACPYKSNHSCSIMIPKRLEDYTKLKIGVQWMTLGATVWLSIKLQAFRTALDQLLNVTIT